MFIRFYFLFILLFFSGQNLIYGMIFDNKYFPLFLKPFMQNQKSHGHFQIQPIFMNTERANGEFEEGRLPDIDGFYDQKLVFNALEAYKQKDTGFLKSDLQSLSSIPWRRDGRVDAQGVAFFYEQRLGWNTSIGTSILLLHYNSRHEFLLENSQHFSKSHTHDLFIAKDKIHTSLGLTPAIASRTGFGDTDLFLRLGQRWRYFWKVRSLDTSFKLGTYIPTAKGINVHNPASLPIGGNKHWGIYGDFELNAEIKEDWWGSFMFRAIKRLKKTQPTRLPLGEEPARYGPLVANIEDDPGWTIVFNPFVTFAGLRDGFGLQVLYTLVNHWRDRLTYKGPDLHVYPPIGILEERSSWRSEYVTASAFYDFSKDKDCSWLPTVYLYWDIPVDFFEPRRSYKTQAISLMVQGDF